MQALLDVILPVFVVIGAGYLAVWKGWFSEAGVDGLMRFTQNFAIPCLLFLALTRLDLGQVFDWRLLTAFYTGAFGGFCLGLLGARFIFGRGWEDSIAIGFCCLFSNSVLLGLPLTERAYGADALSANFAIIALHSPFCYGVGITAMELARARGAPGGQVAVKVLKAMFSNALIIGIVLGLMVNLSGLPLPEFLRDGFTLLAAAALPAALFGLGGVLVRYRPEGDLRVILYVCAVALVAHPAITLTLGGALEVSDAAMRSAVITAAMSPGVNAYIFANMYGAARRVAASAVLIGTALSVLSAWVWLGLLP
ncbi:AEC family transporter [Roseovarius sp. LXJ103]|uniref:AEC family transporter n=1 Tax=Roseovarius carneus TaxID=2853164 RepID=UPI000D610AA0|nr:AEC family transporter [Roseovarius carneus]MBZ8119734.1 AEC family transporter [Roseovarius carneus]PWE34660.1 AEC family transporter [Pelagicola sp. LXJ1103]